MALSHELTTSIAGIEASLPKQWGELLAPAFLSGRTIYETTKAFTVGALSDYRLPAQRTLVTARMSRGPVPVLSLDGHVQPPNDVRQRGCSLECFRLDMTTGDSGLLLQTVDQDRRIDPDDTVLAVDTKWRKMGARALQLLATDWGYDVLSFDKSVTGGQVDNSKDLDLRMAAMMAGVYATSYGHGLDDEWRTLLRGATVGA